MAITFVRADLLSDISDKELTALSTKLVNDGDPEPVDTAIARAVAVVSRYTERFLVPDDQFKGYVRDLAIYFLMPRLGAIPDKRQKAYDQTMRELKDIRDFKFKDLPQRDPLPTDVQPYEGRHGGSPQINTSRHSGGGYLPPRSVRND